MIVRTPAGAVSGGRVAFNDRYAWEVDDYAPLSNLAELRLFAHDGAAEYWAADLLLQPPRIRYRFGLDSADGQRWYGYDGLRDSPRPRGAFEFAYLAEGDRLDAPDWARGAVFYHIFPDRFARSQFGHHPGPLEAWDSRPTPKSFMGGDLDGIVERLDHLTALGVDALYLTPIFSAPSNHKYDTADFFAVDGHFGGDEALARLVAALKRRRMRLILDGVFNHVGATWPPFVDVQARGAASRFASWFYFEGERYETWATNVASLPKLRTSEPEVRELICRVGRHWVEAAGIDGWRLDVANEVDHALWKAFRSAVRGANRECFLVGEIWDLAMPWLRGDEFDSTMNYPLGMAILRYAGARGVAPPLDDPLDGEGFLNAVDRIRAAYPETVHDLLYNLIGSHDAPRPLTRLRDDRAALGVAAALLFTLPGIVSLYYGDEVGMAGGNDPLNRGGMVWDAERQDLRMLSLFRRLGRLRRELPPLRSGAYRRLSGEGGVAVFGRRTRSEDVVVVANPSSEVARVSAAVVDHWLGARPVMATTLAYGSGRASFAGGGLRLPAQSVVLLRGRA